MNILISGAGIAGITAAIYLQDGNHEITVIDRVPIKEHRGYGISLKGFGIEIFKELGLVGQLLDNEIFIDYYSTYDASGNLIRRFSKSLIDELTGGAIPISRAHLHRALFEKLSPSVKMRYGLNIISLNSHDNGVFVNFNNGTSDQFDLLIVAEGIRSSTRRQIWGEMGEVHFDLMYAAGVININHGFPRGEAKTYKGVGCNISFFPVTPYQIAVQASFRESASCRDFSENVFRQLFVDFTKEVTKLTNQIDEKRNMYFDKVGMIKLDKLYKSRVVLLGDAAYCPSFLSGMGASLSLLGAKNLAYQINNSGSNLKDALNNYDEMIRPLAVHFQKNAIANMKREIPPTARSERITKFIMKYIPMPVIKRAVRKQLLTEQDLVNKMLTSTIKKQD